MSDSKIYNEFSKLKSLLFIKLFISNRNKILVGVLFLLITGFLTGCGGGSKEEGRYYNKKKQILN